MSANTAVAGEPALNRKEIQTRVNELRKVDNVRNWIHVIRELLLVGATFGSIVALHAWRMSSGASWLCDILILGLGIFFMGLAIHRLSIIGHEGSHYALFKNRKLNEIVSNWSCMYGVVSTTHLYRLQHMAHHQFTNVPDKDPDLAFMAVVGEKYNYPYGRWRFFQNIALPLLVSIPRQVKYILIRAKIASFGGGYGPYAAKRKQRKEVSLIHTVYLVSVGCLLAAGWYWDRLGLMTACVAGLAIIMGVVESRIPDEWYMKSSIRPVISQRSDLYQRVLFFTVVFLGLAWLTQLTGLPWPIYYVLFWFVPLGTSFPFLMMIREEVQHTNAGQERFSHTRNFAGSSLIRFAIFPLHMGYHLEHHLFPMVPHYNLPELSEYLKTHDDHYRDTITTVEGYLLPHKSVEA